MAHCEVFFTPEQSGEMDHIALQSCLILRHEQLDE